MSGHEKPLWSVTAIYLKNKPWVEREHDYFADNGRPMKVKFNGTEPTQLEERFARQFLQEGFEVRDEHGNVQRPAARGRDGGRKDPQLKLAPNEWIATSDELTVEALAARANLIPGGANFTRRSKRSDVTDFLHQHREAQQETSEAAGGGADADLIDEDEGPMSGAEADSLLGDRNSAVERALGNAA